MKVIITFDPFFQGNIETVTLRLKEADQRGAPLAKASISAGSDPEVNIWSVTP
jgi:hypothetical protein